MSYELGNIHQLHLLNFDSPYNNTCDDRKCRYANSYAYDVNKIKPRQYNSTGKNMELSNLRSISETSLRIQRGSSRGSSINTFRKIAFSLSKKSSKRSLSLNDIKQKLSSSSLIFSDKLKYTVQAVKSQNFLKHKRKGKHEVQLSNPASNKSFQVLFKSEKDKKKIKNQKFCAYCKRLNLFYDSKSSGDLFGYKQNNPNFCYQLFNYPSRKQAKTDVYDQNVYYRDDESFRKHQTNGDENFPTGYYGYTVPVHYNLVNFPCSSNQPCVQEPRTSKSCVHKVSTIDTCPCVDAQVSATSSCFAIPRKEAGDCGVGSHYVISPKREVQCKQIDCTERNSSKRSKCFDYRKPNFFSLINLDLTKNPVSLAKSTLKYILFGVGIIVWSPCIIAVGLYWIITYPLRPQHVLKDETEETKCGACFRCGHNFLHFILHALVQLAKKVVDSHKAFDWLLKGHKPESSHTSLRPCLSRTISARQTSSKKRKHSYPNPKNKYTLYYTRHKGWIMKPIRKRRKSLSRYCECHQSDFQNKGDKQCECYTDDLQNKVNTSRVSKIKSSRKFSFKNSIKKRTLQTKNLASPPEKISTKSSPIRTKIDEKMSQHPSLTYEPIPTKKSPILRHKRVGEISPHKRDRDSSPIQELHSGKTPANITPSLRTPENEAKRSSPKFHKSVSFKGNVPKWMDTYEPRIKEEYKIPPRPQRRLNMNESLHPKASIHMNRCPIRVKRDKIPCPCTFKNILPKSDRPLVCIQKGRPRQINYKQYESKNIPRRRKICCWCETVRKNFSHILKDVEGQAWKCDICDDMFVFTLKRRPWFWIYSYCPSFYPYFLVLYKFYENVVYALMYVITTCIWCPLLCWCYFCCTLFSRCLC